MTNTGGLVPDGSYNIEFKIYDDASAGTNLWTENRTGGSTVTVRNGYFSVYLGDVTPFGSSVPWGQELWMTMNVNSDGEMTPRFKLSAVPYAFQAGAITDAAGNAYTGDDLVQIAPNNIQAVNSALAALRLNQTGSGSLVQLQGDGVNVFSVSKTGATTISGGLTLGTSTSTVAGTVRWTSTDLEVYDGSAWVSLTSGGSGPTGNFFEDGGNSFGGLATLGTNDNFGLAFETNSTEQMRIDTNGNVGIGRTNPVERLDVNGGVRLGNTTSTNAGTLRWNGSDFEGYNGTEWVSLTTGAGGGLGALALGMFYAYESTASVNVSGGWTDLSFNTQVRADNQFTHTAGSAPVTIDEVGWYEITYNVSTSSTGGGNSNATSQARLVEDVGSGFTAIPGSLGSMLHRSGGSSESNVSVTVLREFQVGDQVKLQAQQSAGGLTIVTVPGTVGLTIRAITDASGGSGGGSGLEFVQNGNSFGATAVIGTTDNEGFDIITNNTVALSFNAAGEAVFSEGLTVSTGGLNVTGNSTINGTLSGLTGLSVSSGGLNLNSSGITNAGSITGIGTDITALNGLTISTGAGGSLTLAPSNGLVVFDGSILRRNASGSLTIDLNDGSDTTLVLSNSQGGAVANLSVEGAVSATSFSGSGSGLTGLNASNITTGVLPDGVLSANVARLNITQSFSGLQTFNNGLVVGNTASTTTGAIRWNGVDFQGYDGTQWLSLTQGSGGGGASLLEGVLAFGKVDSNGSPLNISGATVTRNSVGSYTVTLGTAADDANYTILLTIADSSGFNDPNIAVTAQSTAGFSIEIRLGDNGGGADVLADRVWHFTVIDSNAAAGGGSGGGPSGLEFTQGGNSFGTTALFGTTDAQGVSIITDGKVALSIDALGDAVFSEAVTINGEFIVDGAATFNSGLITVGTSVNPGVLSLRSGSNAAFLQTASLSQDRTYTLPDQDGIICLSTGNCSAGDFVEIGGNTTAGALVIGTNNNQALNLKTNDINRLTIDTAGNINVVSGALQTQGTTRLTSAGALQNITGLTITSGGASIAGGISIAGGATISSGGLAVTGNSSVTGTFTASNTVTVTAGGLNITGGINNNSGGITNAGAVAGATTVTASGNINTTGGGLQTNSITRLTNAGALQNITTVTASGNINTTAGVYQVNGVSGVSGSCLGGNNSYLNNITVSGGIITSADCRSGGTLSDERLKENVVSLDASILDNIGLVNTVNFDFKCEDPAFADMNLDCETQTGVIAQELAAIFPELVYQGEDGYYRVKYDALNIYTLRAVSELSKTINSLGDVKAKTVSTNDSIRLTEDGKLQNINGLVLQSGGASIVGGIDNNFGGLSDVGDVLGAYTIEARKLQLETNASVALNLTKDSQDVFTLYNNGALQMRLNSARAFSISDAQGIDLFNVNTEGGLVQIGTQNSSPTAILFILSRKNTPGDPVGVNGAQYYNEFLQRFRCYQDDMWVDCVPASVSEYIVLSSPTSWVQPAEEKESAGNARTWLDLRVVREFRTIVSIEQAGMPGTVCQLQFQIDGENTWNNLGQESTVEIDEANTIRSNWAQVSESARAQEEVQIRFVCQGGDGEQKIGLTTVRLQVR